MTLDNKIHFLIPCRLLRIHYRRLPLPASLTRHHPHPPVCIHCSQPPALSLWPPQLSGFKKYINSRCSRLARLPIRRRRQLRVPVATTPSVVTDCVDCTTIANVIQAHGYLPRQRAERGNYSVSIKIHQITGEWDRRLYRRTSRYFRPLMCVCWIPGGKIYL